MMEYKISKELFEAVTLCGFIKQYQADFYNNERIAYSTESHILEGSYTTEYMTINDFYFECIDFIQTRGYVFVQDTRGYSRIKSLSNGKRLKIWEDEEYNKQRIFDACQYILDNKDE